MKFLTWLVLSSKDSSKYSLTIKSTLLAVIPLLTMAGVDTSSLPQGVDLVVDTFEKTMLLVSSVAALVGFVRKLHTTYLGSNAVLNDSSLR